MDRLLHALAHDRLVDRLPGPVVHAAADDGPSVVESRLDEVELVTALGPVLGLPQVPRLRVHRQTLRVAVPVAPDRRLDPLDPDERVVGGNAAVLVDPVDRPVVVAAILRRMELEVTARRSLTVPDAEEDVALAVEDDARAVVAASPRVRHEDVLKAHQPVVLEAAPADRGRRAVTFGVRLGVAEVDQPVRREVRVRDHVEEPALALREHLGHSGHRIGQEPAVTHDTEPALALGHEHVAVRQERHGPGGHEPVGDRDDAVVVIGGAPGLSGRLCDGRRGRRQGEPGDQGGRHGGASHRDVLPNGVDASQASNTASQA